MLIVALAAGLLTQCFPCCAFAIRSFSKVSATPVNEKVGENRYKRSTRTHIRNKLTEGTVYIQ